jgi:hypothetical protein
MKRFSKKVWVLGGLVVAAAALAVAGYAYFTTAGSGDGSLSTGQIGAVHITNDAVGPLYPQLNPASTTPVAVHVDNTGTGSQYVGQITGAVVDQAGCLGSWFTVAPITAPGVISTGSHDYNTTVILNDNGSNQNTCQDANLTIHWSSAAG